MLVLIISNIISIILGFLLFKCNFMYTCLSSGLSWETNIFLISFLNKDILLIIKFTRMKTAIHVAETHYEGRVSQNVDTCLSVCFIKCMCAPEKKYKSYPFFYSKIKN